MTVTLSGFTSLGFWPRRGCLPSFAEMASCAPAPLATRPSASPARVRAMEGRCIMSAPSLGWGHVGAHGKDARWLLAGRLVVVETDRGVGPVIIGVAGFRGVLALDP